MSTQGERIRQLRSEKKWSREKLASEIKVSKTTILYWERGDYPPKYENLQALASALGSNIDWIVRGEGNKYLIDDFEDLTLSDNGSRSADQQHFRNTDDSIDSKILEYKGKLPVLSWVQAGRWTALDSISDLSEIEEWLPKMEEAGKNGFYLVVRGMSNFPYYLDGDRICINPDVSFDDLQTGHLVVAINNNEGTFKKFVREENQCYLEALNPDWKPKFMEVAKGCRLIGRVVGMYRPVTKHNGI